LLETAPADWLAFLGHPAPGRVRLIDADLSTVTTAADKVLLVEEARTNSCKELWPWKNP
jgi:hypothetical protein